MSIQDYLRGRGVQFEVLLHPPGTSATRRARSVHVSGRSVAKGVLLRSGGGAGGVVLVLALLPSTHRIDIHRLRTLMDLSDLDLASEDDLESVFHDCQRGAIPPFGSLYGLRTVVDASLAGGSDIVVDGNTRHEGIRLRYRDFELIEQPLGARFADFAPPGPDPIRSMAS